MPDKGAVAVPADAPGLTAASALSWAATAALYSAAVTSLSAYRGAIRSSSLRAASSSACAAKATFPPATVPALTLATVAPLLTCEPGLMPAANVTVPLTGAMTLPADDAERITWPVTRITSVKSPGVTVSVRTPKRSAVWWSRTMSSVPCSCLSVCSGWLWPCSWSWSFSWSWPAHDDDIVATAMAAPIK